MIQECNSCDTSFLTEADPYVVYPSPQGYLLFCWKCFKLEPKKPDNKPVDQHGAIDQD